jgi:hypothetical protein
MGAFTSNRDCRILSLWIAVLAFVTSDWPVDGLIHVLKTEQNRSSFVNNLAPEVYIGSAPPRSKSPDEIGSQPIARSWRVDSDPRRR